jgi:hypothetical protein
MAFFPCSNHHAPYRGPSFSAYPAIVAGNEATRGKLRMCEPCFRDYLANAAAALKEVDEATDPDFTSPGCFNVGQNGPCDDDKNGVFVTLYPRGEPPRNFYGSTCRNHWSKAVEEFLLR